LIGILETLISARIADTMTKTEHSQRREVLSFAAANIICGALGGIPATAALARTALNIKSGATSRVAGVINSICVLLLSLVFLRFFKFIPMSTIAALLIMVAVRMVDVSHLKHMYRYDKGHFVIALISALVCVVLDTMAGILVGGVISLLIFTDAMSTGHSKIQLNKGSKLITDINVAKLDRRERLDKEYDEEDFIEESVPMTISINVEENESIANNQEWSSEEWRDTVVYSIGGQLTYINAPAHHHRMQKIVTDEGINNIVLSLENCWYVDLDGIDALNDMITIAEAKERNIVLVGLKNFKSQLAKHPFYQQKEQNSKIFPTIQSALDYLEKDPEEKVV